MLYLSPHLQQECVCLCAYVCVCARAHVCAGLNDTRTTLPPRIPKTPPASRPLRTHRGCLLPWHFLEHQFQMPKGVKCSQWWVKAILLMSGKFLPHLRRLCLIFSIVSVKGADNQQQPYKGWRWGPHSGRASPHSDVKMTLQGLTFSWIWWVTGPSTLSGVLQPPEPPIHDRDQQNIDILLFPHSECFINFPASGPNGNIHFYSLVRVNRYFLSLPHINTIIWMHLLWYTAIPLLYSLFSSLTRGKICDLYREIAES